MQSSVNTSPISQLALIVKAAELTNQREVRISIHQARIISLTLLELLDKINQDYESMFNSLKKTTNTSNISINMDGGGFEES